MKNGLKRLALSGVIGWSGGCTTGPDFLPPDAPRSTTYGVTEEGAKTAEAQGPGGAGQRFAADMDIPAKWWELFHSEALDASVRTALEESPTLAQAMARLRLAQEEFNAAAGTARYPAVNAGVSAARQKVNPSAMGFTGVPVPDPFSLFNASVSVSYALDLTGRNRRLLEGRKSAVDRQEFELEAARQTLAANVVLASIRQAELEKQILWTKEMMSARTRQLDMARERYHAGGISALDLERQGLLLEQTRSLLPALEDQLAQVRRQCAVYLGREPAGVSDVRMDLESLQLPGELPLSLPSKLARQRPDIRAAEALWHQACANVGVATANLYPQITLSASLGSQRTELGDLLDGMNVWSLGGNLMQPIFHGGELKARKRASVAAYEEAAAVYRQTVLRGLQEVADALGALEADARTLKSQSAAVGHAKASHDIVQQQYKAGGISEMALLDEQIRFLQAESGRVQAQAARYADTAALFHALGGGWWNRKEAAPAKSEK